ncbi:hypothetical protein H4R18_001085 [Coemansia javaensis]|uniref:Uncharacterized protein n=1 Tax=Coemansia javaensis TaxID=2761396 RepID=A0A9W8HER9_9FUNG|nr:hypothetical protein H4R18_001085 [Coemansia javaensis]
MRPATGLFAAAALAAACCAAPLPAPQYGPQGMMGGGYGYPMGGPYGMGAPYGPMYMPGGGGGGGASGRYFGGKMRGQRYHAHAGVDEWPMPANPYMGGRGRRGFGRPEFYANGPGDMGDPMMRAPGHNRIPAGDDDSDDDDDNSNAKSSESGTKAAGVNRASASSGADAQRMSELQDEQSAAANSNTSLDLAALSSKIINIGAFDGASMKPTAASGTPCKTGAAQTPRCTPAGHIRHTVTRPLNSNNSHAPTPTAQAHQAAHGPGQHRPAAVARAAAKPAAGSHVTTAPASRLRAHTATPTHAAAAAAAATKAPATKHELPMKNIRGL